MNQTKPGKNLNQIMSGALKIAPKTYEALVKALEDDILFLKKVKMQHVMTFGILIVAEHNNFSFNEEVQRNGDNKVVL